MGGTEKRKGEEKKISDWDEKMSKLKLRHTIDIKKLSQIHYEVGRNKKGWSMNLSHLDQWFSNFSEH